MGTSPASAKRQSDAPMISGINIRVVVMTKTNNQSVEGFLYMEKKIAESIAQTI